MAETATAVPLSVVHTAEGLAPKPSWAEADRARYNRCRVPGEIGLGHQPERIEEVGGEHPFHKTKCMEGCCPRYDVCRTNRA